MTTCNLEALRFLSLAAHTIGGMNVLDAWNETILIQASLTLSRRVGESPYCIIQTSE